MTFPVIQAYAYSPRSVGSLKSVLCCPLQIKNTAHFSVDESKITKESDCCISSSKLWVSTALLVQHWKEEISPPLWFSPFFQSFDTQTPSSLVPFFFMALLSHQFNFLLEFSGLFQLLSFEFWPLLSAIRGQDWPQDIVSTSWCSAACRW